LESQASKSDQQMQHQMDLVMTRLLELEQVHKQRSTEIEHSQSEIQNKAKMLVAAH
jgi:hypothetical protein